MTRIVSRENVLVETRFLWASLAVIFVISGLLVRLWYVQVYRGEFYKSESERNRIRRIEIPAPRGMMFDRNGKIVLGNRPFYDLVYVPQYVKDKDTTFKILSRLLHIPVSVFERRLRMGRGRPKFLPINLVRNLSVHQVSTIESNRIFLPGIEINVAPRRDYRVDTPSHLVGYLGEISRTKLVEYNKRSPDNEYLPGDLIGRQGLEMRWEHLLRGKRGYRLIQVDAFGRRSDSTKGSWNLPIQYAVPGSDLILTIDSDLQNAARQAFKGKYGAVVVLDPQDGQILAMVSEPGFDPTIYQGVLSAEKYRSLASNPFNPFLDKTTGGAYPPGSVYKSIVALAALQERIVTANTQFFCPGSFVNGDEIIHCHQRSGHGWVNLKHAMMKSCDVWFYYVGLELGVDRLAKYARSFGLGRRLGVKLNYERPGLIPTSAWKKAVHGVNWSPGDTPNISIGQGANLITPIQMASLYATLGNGGTIWRPFLVQKAVNHVGETIFSQGPELLSTVDEIDPQHMATIKDALMAVVMDKDGTGKNAAVPGVTVAGKTGTVQVVSLKKNIVDLDVSMKWREHAMFAAFAPVKNPEIAVAVISENDPTGGGGAAAAPVAGKIIDAFFKLKEQRLQLGGPLPGKVAQGPAAPPGPPDTSEDDRELRQ